MKFACKLSMIHSFIWLLTLIYMIATIDWTHIFKALILTILLTACLAINVKSIYTWYQWVKADNKESTGAVRKMAEEVRVCDMFVLVVYVVVVIGPYLLWILMLILVLILICLAARHGGGGRNLNFKGGS